MKIIVFFIALLLGFLLAFFSKNEQSNNFGSIYIYVILLIFSIYIIKFLFPITKKLEIGTYRFYPNLIKEILKFFK